MCQTQEWMQLTFILCYGTQGRAYNIIRLDGTPAPTKLLAWVMWYNCMHTGVQARIQLRLGHLSGLAVITEFKHAVVVLWSIDLQADLQRPRRLQTAESHLLICAECNLTRILRWLTWRAATYRPGVLAYRSDRIS